MKKIFYSILLVACIGLTFAACSNGAYVANPSSSTNSGASPLLPLTLSQMQYTGTAPFSADINGSHWVAANTYFTYNAGVSVITATFDSTQFYLHLKNVYNNGLYDMSYADYTNFCVWCANIVDTNQSFTSYWGNSGEVHIIQDYDTAQYIQGTFYFKGVTRAGKVVSVQNGYFYLPKW